MNWALPLLIFALLAYAYARKTDVYSAFTAGAAQALPVLVRILPGLAAMMVSLSVFRGGGAMEALVRLLSPLCRLIGIPGELMPLFLLRPFSGSAALALLRDVYDSCGADSRLGYAASVMLGSTETVFYTVSLYMGSVGVTKPRHAVPASLAAAVAGTAAALAFAAIKGV